MNLLKTLCICITILFFPICIFPSENPEIIWRFTTGGRIISPPAEGSDGTIYFCSEDRYLYALNSDGAVLWRTDLEDRITETLSIGPDGTIYAGSKRDFLIAVNLSGEKIWKIKLKGSIVGNPAIKPDGSLFIVTDSDWLYSISHTGFIRWLIKLPATPVLGPVLGRDIYITLDNERIYSYNVIGKRQWVFLLSGNAESLVLSRDNIYAGTDNSTLVSIDFSGIRVWNISLYGPVRSIIVLSEERFLCTSGNYIIMLDSGGNIIWTNSERNLQIDLAAYSNLVVSLDSEGRVSWFNLDGLSLNQIKGGIPVHSFLVASDGFVYLGSKDWLLYKYGFTDTVNDNYIKYIWPAFGGGVKNRAYLLTSKIEQQTAGIFRSSDYVYLMEISKLLDEKKLNMLIDEIELRLYNQDYDSGKIYLIDIIKLLASECTTRPLYEEGRLINNFPIIRSRAIDILGITGNLDTINFLVEMLNFEWDGYVINSIIRSLGNLQSDKNNIISEGILSYYNTKTNTYSRFISQILITAQKMDRYNGNTSKELLTVITDIFLTSSSRAIKELSLDTINSLKK